MCTAHIHIFICIYPCTSHTYLRMHIYSYIYIDTYSYISIHTYRMHIYSCINVLIHVSIWSLIYHSSPHVYRSHTSIPEIASLIYHSSPHMQNSYTHIHTYPNTPLNATCVPLISIYIYKCIQTYTHEQQ